MKAILAILLCAPIAALAQPTPAATKNSAPVKSSKADAHRSEDIARHRQIAKAHEEAARCIEAGTDEKQCHQRLRDACKGIAVGRYCGMRHAH